MLSTFPVGVGVVTFSHDGNQLVTANWDNTIRTSTLSIEALIQLAQQRLPRNQQSMSAKGSCTWRPVQQSSMAVLSV